MIRKIALAALFLTLGAASVLAADISGKWTADVPGRNGNTQTITFTFVVSGSTVTGKVTTQRGDSDITDGKIDGDTLTFSQTMNFGGNSMTMQYTGKIAGDTINFSRQAGDRPAVTFVAKRAAQ